MISTLPKLSVQHAFTINVVEYEAYQCMIHSVRYAVFVCEQSIPADLEIDQSDPVSQHVLAWWDGRAVGTGRLTPGGRIGRVAVAQSFRRRGIGRCIVELLLDTARQQRYQTAVLAAQQHAIPFYEQLGFCQEGNLFEELGIDHVMMRKQLL